MTSWDPNKKAYRLPKVRKVRDDSYTCLYNHDRRCKEGASGLWAVTIAEMKQRGYAPNDPVHFSESCTDEIESEECIEPERYRRNEVPKHQQDREHREPADVHIHVEPERPRHRRDKISHPNWGRDYREPTEEPSRRHRRNETQKHRDEPTEVVVEPGRSRYRRNEAEAARRERDRLYREPRGGMATRLHQGTFSCPNLREESNEENDDVMFELPPSYTSLPHLDNPRDTGHPYMGRRKSYLSQKFMRQLELRKRSGGGLTGYKNQGFEIENGEYYKGNGPHDSVEYGQRRPSAKKETKPPEAEEEEPETLAENFLGFTQYTSFHGVHFMWELGTTWFRRILWFLLFFGSLAFLIYQISNRIAYLASAPVMVKVEVNFNKTIRFPSMALCNQNAYRVLWFLLFFGSLSFLLFQISNRIMFLASAPVMVQVEVNFNKTIRFPSVALCNQNVFTITRAAALKKLDLIKAIYQPKGGTKGQNVTEILQKYGAQNLTDKELLISMGHTKEDMIVSCKWEGKDCGPHNFTMEFTDHGLCYIFNLRPRNASLELPDNPKVTKNTGAAYGLGLIINVETYEYTAGPYQSEGIKFLLYDNRDCPSLSELGSGLNAGLRLLLNIENYEAMTGPHESAGLKFLLYDRNDLPTVFEMGLGMPTGNHAFIGLSVSVMKRMEPPYGNCTSNHKLKYFSYYTQMACKRECWTDFFVKNCNCTLPYMNVPNLPGCTKDVAMICENATREEFEKNMEACSCRPGCETFFYQPNLSYLKSAKADVYKLFEIANKTKLQENFARARDTVTATSTEQLKEDAGMLNKLVVRADDVRLVLDIELPHAITRMQKHLVELANDTSIVFEKINEVYNFQRFILDWRFYRPVVSKHQSYFSPVTIMYRELIADTYRKFERITSETGLQGENIDMELKRALHAVLDDRLAARSTISKAAKEQMDLAITQYKEAKAMALLKYKDSYPEDQHMMIIPRTILKEAVTLPKQKKLLDLCLAGLKGLQDSYVSMGRYLIDVFFKKMTYRRADFYKKRVKPYEDICETYDTNLGLAMHDSFRYPLSEIDGTIATIKAQQFDVQKILKEMKALVDSAEVELKHSQLIYAEVYKVVTGALDMIQDEKQGKTAVSMAFTNADFLVKLNKLRNFFENTKGRNSDVQDKYNALKMAEATIARLILSNTDLKDYFAKYVPIFKDQASLDAALGYNKLDEYKVLDELSPVYGQNHTRFFDSMDLVQTDMKAYLDGNKLDEKYYAANFISMDIFFRELYYQEISQQAAYTIISLLSDIGGSMGLYIGASLLSIFEIFDMLIFYFYRKSFKKKEEKEQAANKAEKEKTRELESFHPPMYDGLVDRRRNQPRETSLTRNRRTPSVERYPEPEPLAHRPSSRDRDHRRRDPSPRDHDRRKKSQRPKSRRPTDQRKLVDGSSTGSPAGQTPTPVPQKRSPLDPNHDIDFADDSPSFSPPRRQSPSRNRSKSPKRHDSEYIASPSDSRDDSIPDPSFSRPDTGRRGVGEPDGQPDNSPVKPFYSKGNIDSEINSSSHSASDSLGPQANHTPSPGKRYQSYNPMA